jgi:CheY-like chemotaxis protein
MSLAQKTHLLLIDDDEDDYFILKEVIASFFPSVIISYFGESDCINRSLFRDITIVLLDINMPKRDGFECLDVIRKEYDLTELPIVMYSNSYAERDVKAAYQKGANLFVSKPLTLENTKMAIDQILLTDWSNLSCITEEHRRLNKVFKY